MLQSLNAMGNKITDLTPLQDHKHLSYLDLSYNQIQNKDMISVLNTLPLLVTLQMSENPVETLPASTWIPKRHYPHHPTATYPPSYRLSVVFTIPKLNVFNSLPVSAEERVAAINCYNPPTDVLVSIQHTNHQQLQAKVYARIRAEDLMRSKRLRPIVLCGPNGVGKR
jgi:Leucine-rich repeat (LRR) protein